MNKPKKKGNFAFMQNSVVALAVIILVLAFVSLVLSNVQQTLDNPAGALENVSSLAENITVSGLDALTEFSNFLTPIALIVIIVVILGFLFLLSGRRGGSV